MNPSLSVSYSPFLVFFCQIYLEINVVIIISVNLFLYTLWRSHCCHSYRLISLLCFNNSGTTVAQAQAQHPDGTRRGISYSLFSGNRNQVFTISSLTGETHYKTKAFSIVLWFWCELQIASKFCEDKHISLICHLIICWSSFSLKSACPSGEISVKSSKGLDFEDTPRLRLVVKAETVSSTSFMAFNLILQDVNDNLPRFQLQNYVAYMREAQGYEMPIIQVLNMD